VGKALGSLDGIGRYTRGLLAGLCEVEASLPHRERFEYLLYRLYRCEQVVDAQTLLPPTTTGFIHADEAPRAGEVDLFHATAWAVPVAHRGPLTLTLYDLTFVTLAETHTVENRVHCSVGLARALARGATLCAISQSVRAEAAARLALDPARIAVASPGVDARFVPQAPDVIASARRELGIGERYVLGVGTLEPRKNLAGLVAAWNSLPSALRDAHELVLAGGEGWSGGSGDAALASIADRLPGPGGGAGRVRHLGRVSDALLPALYSGAAAFAYPSLGEGFGLPPLEAMACGAPVVASDRPAIPEALGDAAELVDPTSTERLAAALERLLTDRDHAARLRAAGRRRAELFTWRATAESMRDCWARTIHRAGASSR
jgi:alpha-1,3-rhamnosyl/mannosyltransferase